MKYPKDIDKEYIPYLDKLNNIDWFESVWSCTGHKRQHMENTEGYLTFYVKPNKFLKIAKNIESLFNIDPLIWATVITRDGKIGYSIYYPENKFKETIEKLIEICESKPEKKNKKEKLLNIIEQLEDKPIQEKKMDFQKDLEYRNEINELKEEIELVNLENANLEGQIIVYKEIINKLIGENK